MSIEACKIGIYVHKMIIMLFAWSHVLSSFKFFVKVNFPTKFSILKNKNSILILWTFLALLISAINVFNLYYTLKPTYFSDMLSNQTNNFTWICSSTSDTIYVNEILTYMFRSWVPMFMIAIFNLTSFIYLPNSKMKICEKQADDGSNEVKYCRDCGTTATGIYLLLILLILNIPLCVNWILKYFYPIEWNIWQDFRLFDKIAECMANSYPVFPLFLNLIYCKSFRKDFISIFKAKNYGINPEIIKKI